MTFIEYLTSKGLTEEQAKNITDGMPGENFYLASEEKLDERYAKMKGQKEEMETQISTIQKEIDALRESSKGSQELTQQLTDLQKALDESKAESEQKLALQQKDFAIKFALKDSGALDTDIVLGLLNKDTINVTDGGLMGLKDQLQQIKTDKPFLFPVEDSAGTKPNPQIVTSGNPTNQDEGDNDPFAAKLAKYN